MVKECIKCKKLDFLNPHLTFYWFPKDSYKREMWITSLNLKTYVPKCSCICSEHFNKNDYKMECGVWALKEDALPKSVCEVSETRHNSDALKLETESKSLLVGCVSIEESIKSETFDIKSEEEDIADSSSLNHVTRKVCGNPTDINMCLNRTSRGNYLAMTQAQRPTKVRYLIHETLQNLDWLHCLHCNYQTTRKGHLKSHLRRHKNRDELKLFQCDQCDYRSMRKYDYKNHLLLHGNPEELNCNHCEYKTFRKSYLIKHLAVHTNPEERCWFQCYHCDFRTIQKRNLTPHLLKHRSPKELDWIRCAECDYKTIRKTCLKKHLLKHKNPEVDWFRCDQCDYRTFRKNNFRDHVRCHKNPDELVWFRCKYCDYKTVRKGNLNRHSSRCGLGDM